jgi:hypothetical protein
MTCGKCVYGVLLLSQLAGTLALPSTGYDGAVRLPIVRKHVSRDTRKRDGTSVSGPILNEQWFYGIEGSRVHADLTGKFRKDLVLNSYSLDGDTLPKDIC